jgi:hypothetical protein
MNDKFEAYAAKQLELAQQIDQLRADSHNLYVDNLETLKPGTKVEIIKNAFVHNYKAPYIHARDNEQMNRISNTHVGSVGIVVSSLHNNIGIKLADEEVLVNVWQIKVLDVKTCYER